MVMAAARSVVVSFMAYKLYAMDEVYAKRYDEVGIRERMRILTDQNEGEFKGKSDGGRDW